MKAHLDETLYGDEENGIIIADDMRDNTKQQWYIYI